MKKFILKILFFIALMPFTALFSFFVVKCQYQEGYNASILDKIERLKNIKEPKIIIAGNSNAAFGLKSKLIEDAFKMPVVNLGLHGGLGNMFCENMAKANITSGDIVILTHSDFSDNGDIPDTALAWITVEYHKELWDLLIPPSEYLNMLKAYPKYIIKSLKLWLTLSGNKTSDSSYSRNAFNKYGDVVYKPEKGRVDPEKYFKKRPPHVPKINDICINRINKLNKYLNDRGAVLLIAGYPIASGDYTPPAENYIKFQEKLIKSVNCEVISNYVDYFIPYRYFYDSDLHLNDEGAELRTIKLINDIKNRRKTRDKLNF